MKLPLFIPLIDLDLGLHILQLSFWFILDFFFLHIMWSSSLNSFLHMWIFSHWLNTIFSSLNGINTHIKKSIKDCWVYFCTLNYISLICLYIFQYHAVMVTTAVSVQFSSATQSCPTLCNPISYHLHIWGYWYFSQQSWFQLMLLPAQRFSWCTLHIS